MLSEEQLHEIEKRTDDNAQSLNYFCTDLHEDVRRYLKHVDDVRTLLETVRELQERVAELEADARLGRMVREMPEGVSLHHNCNGYDEWSCEYGKTWTWEPTPDAALEAARKEET